MTKQKIIYIEDEARPRISYLRLLRRIFGDEFEVIAPEPEKTIQEMLWHLEQYTDVVLYVIDERLSHAGVADYTGLNLVKEIRIIDQKIPVYILTSHADDIDPVLGDVEYVIDKNDINDDKNRSQLAMRMMRHLNTFNDIKSDRAIRLDELLKKSIGGELSYAEREEFDRLNFLRAKPILLEEQGESEVLKAELDKQDALLKQIEAQLKNTK